ncbi:hypothetical protein GOP47_0008299 [Adiantum capillus-veneris]|uniref:Mediator of RNA polymerase II transcription subunit 21 n=1 Tax=Adiantum capillus-veneris TaxID=13818 RepID=A0A9D4UYA4_ADICA|nr:hypothetical protein GOP47_0008299 [Adiantum capillus-veneris]
MDIVSQLQDQVNKIAFLACNTVGPLQRDAPSSRLSQHYPEPPPPPSSADGLPSISDPKAMAAALVQAAKEFDALIAALPITEGGEEAQLKVIAMLQAENEEVGQELQKELEAADAELMHVRELFHTAADNCLRLNPPQ